MLYVKYVHLLCLRVKNITMAYPSRSLNSCEGVSSYYQNYNTTYKSIHTLQFTYHDYIPYYTYFTGMLIGGFLIAHSGGVSRQLRGNEVPVNKLVDKGLFVGLTHVLVVKVVSVLPYIHSKDRHRAGLSQRVISTDGLGDLEASGSIY